MTTPTRCHECMGTGRIWTDPPAPKNVPCPSCSDGSIKPPPMSDEQRAALFLNPGGSHAQQK